MKINKTEVKLKSRKFIIQALETESPKKRRLRPHPAHNTIELPPYRAESQHLTLQLISNATIGVNIALTDCSSQDRVSQENTKK